MRNTTKEKSLVLRGSYRVLCWRAIAWTQNQPGFYGVPEVHHAPGNARVGVARVGVAQPRRPLQRRNGPYRVQVYLA